MIRKLTDNFYQILLVALLNYFVVWLNFEPVEYIVTNLDYSMIKKIK